MLFTLAGSGLETRAAIDPIAFFIAIIIIYNVVVSIAKAAQRQATKSLDNQTRGRLNTALQQSRQTVEAARAAQLARLREALAAARSAQASQAASQTETQAPTTITFSAKVPILVATTAPPPPTPPAPPPSRAAAVITVASPTPPDAAMQPGLTLGGFETGTLPFPDLMGAQAILTPAPVATDRRAALAVLQGPRSGANLFVAAAIVGPCAAFRPIGHTPGGW